MKYAHPPCILQHVIDNLSSMPFLLPLGIIVATLVVLVVLTVACPQWQDYWCLPLAVGGLLVALYCIYAAPWQETAILCNQLLVYDAVVTFFHLLLIGITVLTLLAWHGGALMRSKLSLKAENLAAEQVVLLLGNLLGACCVAMAYHWLSLYLGLTLLALTTALLLYSSPTALAAEASLKYLLYSMVVAAIMLWGVSCLYGLTRTLTFEGVATGGLAVGWPLLLALSSLLFTMAVFPLHFWLPDVYQGAPAVVVAYLATVPKLAALAALLRIFHHCAAGWDPVLHAHARYGLGVLALWTLVIGNGAALLQVHGQRMMAYASIAQGGLLLAGIAVLQAADLRPVLFYSAVYGIMGWAGFVSMGVLERLSGSSMVQGYAGLGRKWPVLGVAITVIMLALTGLPPTAGFMAKWLLLVAVWQQVQGAGGVLWMALGLMGLLSTILSLYYYLRQSYVLFFREGPSTAVEDMCWVQWSMIVGVAGGLVGGFWYAHSWLQALAHWLGA